jgi:hypothetical protein
MESLAGKHAPILKEAPFTIKMIGLKENAPITHISDLQCEFYNYDEKASGALGDVIAVKFDDQDSFIAATYSSGQMCIYNSFTGKVTSTLNFN